MQSLIWFDSIFCINSPQCERSDSFAYRDCAFHQSLRERPVPINLPANLHFKDSQRKKDTVLDPHRVKVFVRQISLIQTHVFHHAKKTLGIDLTCISPFSYFWRPLQISPQRSCTYLFSWRRSIDFDSVQMRHWLIHTSNTAIAQHSIFVPLYLQT